MNTRLAALIVATALSFDTADANIARAGDASQSRETGVGRVIGQQGNDALHRIRIELASTLQRSVTLPELPEMSDVNRNIVLADSRTPSRAEW